jgi:hypothetical protein
MVVSVCVSIYVKNRLLKNLSQWLPQIFGGSLNAPLNSKPWILKACKNIFNNNGVLTRCCLIPEVRNLKKNSEWLKSGENLHHNKYFAMQKSIHMWHNTSIRGLCKEGYSRIVWNLPCSHCCSWKEKSVLLACVLACLRLNHKGKIGIRITCLPL